MTIRKECAEIGEKLLNSREILREALDLAAHAKSVERLPSIRPDVVSRGLAKDMINQAKELSREVELPKEEGMRLEVSLASALDSINKSDYDTAISHILQARRSLLDLMFQKVVACECGEAKAIEARLGKQALARILEREPNLGAFICGQCGERFHSMKELNEHLRKYHPEAYASVRR